MTPRSTVTPRSHTIATGLGALAKCALLLLGVPVALARLWTLAPGADALDRRATWLGSSGFGHAALAAVWVIWCASAASLVRDVAMACRGALVAPHRSWSARWASRVAGLLLVLSASSAGAAAGASASIRAAHTAFASSAHLAGSASGGASAPRRVAMATYVVRPGDCLESIATRELGDAAGWTTLSRLNMGRMQPDGRRMVEPSLIYPGWVLVLPGDAAAHRTPTARADQRRARPVIGASSLDVDTRGPRSTPASRGPRRTQAAGSVAAAPPVAAELRSGRRAWAEPVAPPGARGPSATGRSTAATSPASSSPTRRLAELALLGLGVLTTVAIARRLRIARTIAACLRRPGERAVEPSRAIARVAAAIDPLAESTLLDWVDGANRLLWRSCGLWAGARELPAVRLVRAGAGGVELLLETALPDAAEGFVALDGGRVWALDATIGEDELASRTNGCGRYVPSLVPLGDAEDATYLAALPAGRRLTIEPESGESVAADLDAIVLALRTLPWSDELQVELVGVAPPPASHGCHHVAPSSRAELEALARSPGPGPSDRLETSWSSELLVVVGEPRPPGVDEDLLLAVGDRAGIVSVGGRGSISLLVGRSHLMVQPDGITLERRRPSPDQLDLVDALLARPESTPAPDPPEAWVGSRARVAAERRGRVEVHMLAPSPALDGISEQPSSKDRGRVVELVAYLATHGHEATTDAIREQVFARSDRVASLGRIHNVCSAARSALGTATDDRCLLPTGTSGRYRLHREVTCDWSRFEQMRAAARGIEAGDAVDLLTEALSLVSGRPCADVATGWDWLISEGLQSTMISAIVDAGHHLASLAIAGHDLELANWAITTARLAEPCSEILVRDAMIVADLRGDRDLVRREWRDLERTLAHIDGDEPSSETRALYDELVGAGGSPQRRYRSARNG